MKILQHNEITKRSMPVQDIEREVKPYVDEMVALCHKVINGRAGIAIAHCQFDKDNPLRFYVMANGDAIVNPFIISAKEKTLMWHSEGCLSFAYEPEIKVQRYRILKARYMLFTNNEVQIVEKNIKDMYAFVMQHEIDHFNLKYIYDKEKII